MFPDSQATLNRRRMGLMAGALWAVMAGCGQRNDAAVDGFKGIDVTGAPYGRGLALTDMRGRLRTLADFHGQVVMLYFGFVQCPDVCPTALTRASEIMRLLGPEQAAQVQVLFVTVDPERDTPELLRDFMAAFDARFLALRGNAEQTQAVAQAFKVFYKKVPTGSSYTMDHSAQSYLLDPKGRLRVVLRHEQTATEYAHDIQALLQGA